jgi:hypothetical protein
MNGVRGAVLIVLAMAGRLTAGDAVVPGEVRTPFPTITNLAVEWEIGGDEDLDATCAVSYRALGAADWRGAMPLVRVPAGESRGTRPIFRWTNRLSGSLLDLEPGTEYEIQLTLRDPDGGDASRVTRVRTRPEPVVPPDAVVRRGGKAELNRVGPGEVLLLDDGEYGSVRLNRDGEPGRPIVIRGESGKATFREVILSGRRWVYLEGVTVNGPVRLDGAADCVVRRCTIRAQYGIKAYRPGIENCLIENNTILGIQPWKAEIMGASGANDGEGIQITGSGNVIRHNLVSGFRDCLSHLEDAGAAAQQCNDWLNNDVRLGLDDGIEADFALSNCRVMRNRITNCFVGISSQPGLGGPNYFVRNVMFNLTLIPFKLHRGSRGDVILHNTAVKVGDALALHPGDPFDGATFRNNLFVGGPTPVERFNGYAPGRGRAADVSGVGGRCDFDYNAYAAHGGLPFEGRIGAWRFTSLPGTEYERHGVRVGLDALAVPTFPDDPLREYEPPDLRPRGDGPLVDRAMLIPNVNDSFRGAGPDLGAYEAGEALPVYGPRR